MTSLGVLLGAEGDDGGLAAAGVGAELGVDVGLDDLGHRLGLDLGRLEGRDGAGERGGNAGHFRSWGDWCLFKQIVSRGGHSKELARMPSFEIPMLN